MVTTAILTLSAVLGVGDPAPPDSVPGAGHRSEVLWTSFPGDAALMQDDVRSFVDSIIVRHGRSEWEAGVLTNELHRHLGIYNVIGVKMGVRALERLGAGFDQVRVECEAGTDQPLSCLHDGLQVATGASLGRGLYRVSDGRPAPQARFSANGRTLELTIRPEIIATVAADIRALTERHGFATPAYFEAIRGLSMRRWLEWDRSSIFIERFLQ
ncbi:MAG: formylmethanofuran dehydrogenase subunit E family protein [Bacteroidetes bacterium]|jgi:pyrimidine-specific ribonucleoside hydrolase|nr:formylmethanofuran dehydrogenase subunit E family protein [Bacteroidota bacterium]